MAAESSTLETNLALLESLEPILATQTKGPTTKVQTERLMVIGAALISLAHSVDQKRELEASMRKPQHEDHHPSVCNPSK